MTLCLYVQTPPVLENKIGANAPMRIGEGVEPCNMLPFGKPRYRCDHQSAAKIRIKYQTTKLSCYRCHSTLRNPMKNVPSYSVQRQKHVKQYGMFSSLTPTPQEGMLIILPFQASYIFAFMRAIQRGILFIENKTL